MNTYKFKNKTFKKEKRIKKYNYKLNIYNLFRIDKNNISAKILTKTNHKPILYNDSLKGAL